MAQTQTQIAETLTACRQSPVYVQGVRQDTLTKIDQPLRTVRGDVLEAGTVLVLTSSGYYGLRMSASGRTGGRAVTVYTE